jgi:hypothetical protein
LLLAVPAYKQCAHYTTNVFHQSKNTKIFKTAQISSNGKKTEAQTVPAIIRQQKPSGGNHEC